MGDDVKAITDRQLVRGACLVVRDFGPLYVVDTFRDGSGRVAVAINGIDGIHYNFNAHEVERVLTREEFDRMPKVDGR